MYRILTFGVDSENGVVDDQSIGSDCSFDRDYFRVGLVGSNQN